MINLLYCIDENYNEQLFTSLTSITNKVKNKLNVYILHEKPISFIEHEKKINTDIYIISFIKFTW